MYINVFKVSSRRILQEIAAWQLAMTTINGAAVLGLWRPLNTGLFDGLPMGPGWDSPVLLVLNLLLLTMILWLYQWEYRNDSIIDQLIDADMASAPKAKRSRKGK